MSTQTGPTLHDVYAILGQVYFDSKWRITELEQQLMEAHAKLASTKKED